MKVGEYVYVATNAELLNQLLGTHYTAWMKSYIPWGIGAMIWMPRLDGKVRAGWRNFMLNGKIIEEYLGGRPYPSNIDVGLRMRKRAVFEKCDAGGFFIFRGVFEVEADSTLTRRTLRPIKDEIFE